MAKGHIPIIIFGIIFLISVFLCLWFFLTKKEKTIKKYEQKFSVHHQKLQANQFYLSKVFRGLHIPEGSSWMLSGPFLLSTCVFILSILLFGFIAEDVISRDPLTIADTEINKWFFERTSPLLTTFMLSVADCASYPTTLMVYLILVVVLSIKKRWYGLTFLSLSIPGEMLLNHFLKVTFHRHRPLFHLFYSPAMDYSFPSGHVMNATMLYSLLALFALSIIKQWKWQVFTVLFAILGVIFVAVSRVYLGYHYVSDTLGAAAMSLAWLSLCFMITTALKYRNTSF